MGHGAAEKDAEGLLRRRAEALLAEKPKGSEANRELDQLLHELEVRQVELELQNQELRAAQDEVQTSRDRYFELYDLAPIAYLTLDRAGAIVECNLTASALLGEERLNLIGRPLASFTDGDSGNILFLHLAKVFASGLAERCEIVLHKPEGPAAEPIPVQMDTLAAGDPTHDRSECRTALTDLSDRLRAEAALARSEARFRAVFESSPEGITIVAADGRIIEANAAFASFVGQTIEELLGTPISELILPDHRSALASGFADVRSGSRACSDLETRWRSKERDEVWGHITCASLPDPIDGSERFLALVQDTTARKRAETALRQSVQRFTDLVGSLPIGVFVLDRAWRCVAVNAAGASMLQNTPDEIVGQPLREAQFGIEGSPWLDLRPRVIEKLESVVSTDRFRISDQQAGWFEARFFPVEEGACLLVENVTDRVELTEALRTAKEAAEASSTAKSAFLAAMSHEIRTPMNGIMGMAELLETTSLLPIQREYLTMVQDSAASLLQLVDDILDFSHMEVERLELEVRPFRVRELVDNTVSTFADQAHAKQLDLACWVSRNVPVGALGDPLRMRQVLVNLIGNAVKFTERGQVVVEVDVEPGSASVAELSFAVRDTGPGIPADRLDTIFEPFERVDVSSTRRIGGVGLGLTIAWRLARSMGGAITVSSTPGQGSRFVFTIALPVASSEEVPPDAPAAFLAGAPALIVDPCPLNRKILVERLEGWGLIPITLPEPGDVIAELRRAVHEARPFAVVLLSAELPDADGFAVAAAILGDVGPEPKIIMMLASTDLVREVQRCTEIGIEQFVLKPVKHRALLDSLEASLGQVGAPSPPAAVAAPSRPLRVLVAEDNRVSQRLMVGLLTHWGHTVSVAASGREAVAAFEAQPRDRPFDIVFMDIQMPEMDGFQATSAIRSLERESARHVPIIALTAHAMRGDREQCLAAGMDEYLRKPISAADLRRALERYVPASALSQTSEPEEQ